MFIGRLAQAAGVNVQTVRYYERLGLLLEPARTRSGYRIYPENALKRVQFIKRAKVLGFSLAEIKALFDLSDDGKRPCTKVRNLARAKLAEVDQSLKTYSLIAKNSPYESSSGMRCPMMHSMQLCVTLSSFPNQEIPLDSIATERV